MGKTRRFANQVRASSDETYLTCICFFFALLFSAKDPSHVGEAILMPMVLAGNSLTNQPRGHVDTLSTEKDPYVVKIVTVFARTKWPHQLELRKFDGFSAMCLRSMLLIPLSCISRISHATVLQRSRCEHLPAALKFRQLLLGQTIAVLHDDDVRRQCTFQPTFGFHFALACPKATSFWAQVTSDQNINEWTWVPLFSCTTRIPKQHSFDPPVRRQVRNMHRKFPLLFETFL